jgi:predicted nucleic acid-binding protein
MLAYVDTSILLKSYVAEPDSDAADVLIQDLNAVVVLSEIHRMEIVNALRLKHFRNEITQPQLKAAIRTFENDIETGVYRTMPCDLKKVFFKASELSQKCSGILGTRSLDLLHVAYALELGCTVFASGDTRQLKAAEQAGLKICSFSPDPNHTT